jgi:hypothetical protein
MSFENPTRLRIGMHGSFNGMDYRVVGRSVLGESEDGEVYYWNEFNLENKSGKQATLVFEETENGPQWRLFTLFDPEYPMPAADAAAKSVGDWLNLTGDNVRVTFRGASQVYYVEGTAPEGEGVGKTAEYFNAEAGGIMQVVSWTGDEVEFYNGMNLTRGMVATAFGLPQDSTGKTGSYFSPLSGSNSGNYLSGAKFALFAILAIILFLPIFGGSLFSSGNHEAPPVKKLLVGARPLEVGAAGTLFDKKYRITAHAVVDIAEDGANWERHEYELTDDYGANALLVCGDKSDGADWVLFEQFSPMEPPPAKELAARQIGGLVELDGFTGKVTDIFLSTIEQTDGDALNGLKKGDACYDIRCNNEYRTMLARWNDAGIQFYHGRTIAAKKGAACFMAAK